MSDCSTEAFKPHARMTKTKSQLRAEAVERLRKLNCMDVDCYQLLEATVDDAGEKVGYRVEIRKLIELLTDNETCPNGDGTCPDADGTPSIEQGDDGVAKLDAQARAEIEDAERSRAVSGDAAAEVDSGTGGTEKTPQEPRECARITFTDTREMLEADVSAWIANEMGVLAKYGIEDAVLQQAVFEWLDRQAAITQNETIHDYNIAARESGRILRDEIAELQADNDCLRDRNEKLDYEVRDWKGEAKTQRNNFYQATEARKHWQRKYENLKATSYSAEAPSDESELARELGKALAERDMYREKLGRALDAAHEIARMMEVER